MIGVLINAAAIVVGGIFGLLFNKGISQKLSDALMTSIGLCVMAIGITGIMKGENTLVLILAAVCGTLIGVTKIKVANPLPGIFFAPVFTAIFALFGI